MSNFLKFVIFVLAIAVLAMGWMLFVKPKQLQNQNPPVPGMPGAATNSDTTAPASAGASLHDRVHISNPKPLESVGSTFDVTGDAPGNWYFEAVFPIQVRDSTGKVVGRGPAKAQTDWMTTGQVAFYATINIDNGYSGPGTLVLLKDNPSGLPQNDDSIEIPITIQ